MECLLLTSKNSAKLKQYYYFHAKFLEEVRYMYICAVFTITAFTNHFEAWWRVIINHLVFPLALKGILASFTQPLKQNAVFPRESSPIRLAILYTSKCWMVVLHDFVVLVLVEKGSHKSRNPDKSLTTTLLVYLEYRAKKTSWVWNYGIFTLHSPVLPPSQLAHCTNCMCTSV